MVILKSTESEAQAKASDHLSGYQARDLEVVDYRMTELESTGLMFRGPFPDGLDRGEFFSCIGAAQTLGCFCQKPYPELVAEEIGLPALNLGYGGAGPEFYVRHPELIEMINRGRFLVVQAMSGRSQSNSIFESGGLEYLRRKSDGSRVGAQEAYRELLEGPSSIRNLPLGKISRGLARRVAIPGLQKIVGETRNGWLESMRQLVKMVEVPIVFLWFSKRTPDYAEGIKTVRELFGEFPHLINQSMVGEVREMCDAYVECVSDRGSPQPLFSRFTGEPVTVDPSNDRPDLGVGEPWSHNIYYPSPEMHEDAAKVLVPACSKLLQTSMA
ncbi:MAG: DUF6473 family protein [Verrucomicrobiota bacterium]